MGDRVFCDLSFLRPPAPELLQLIHNTMSAPDEIELGGMRLNFYEINYGRLAQEVQDWILSHRLTAVWGYDGGGDWTEGCDIFHEGEGSTWHPGWDGRLQVSIADVDKPEVIERTRRWDAVYQSIRDAHTAARRLGL